MEKEEAVQALRLAENVSETAIDALKPWVTPTLVNLLTIAPNIDPKVIGQAGPPTALGALRARSRCGGWSDK